MCSPDTGNDHEYPKISGSFLTSLCLFSFSLTEPLLAPSKKKNNIKFEEETIYVNINNSNQGYFDLELMKNCKHNIIANSSFSWWGAWLNENPEKIVIAPKKWLAQDNFSNDIIPENWIKIDN